MMRLLIIIFLILACVAGQDLPFTEGPDPAPPEIDIMEPPVVDDIGPGQPIPIFQELPKAGAVIADFFMGSEADHDLFLSDAYWPVPLGNNTTLNLTA